MTEPRVTPSHPVEIVLDQLTSAWKEFNARVEQEVTGEDYNTLHGLGVRIGDRITEIKKEVDQYKRLVREQDLVPDG